ncbi:MAG: MFS transporter [Candidatus Brocadiia bacterium]
MSPDQARKNALFHALDGIFFFAGLTLFNRQTVMPRLITELSDSELLLGLVPAIFWMGNLVPQIIAAKKLEGLAYKKPAILICGLFQRLGWVVLLISMLIWWDPVLTLAIFFIVLTGYRLASGVTMPLWTDFYGKTTSEGVWARVLGFRRAVAGVLGVALGLLIRWIMGRFPSPDRYQLLLLLAVVSYGISYFFLSRIQEEREDGLPNNHDASWGEYLKGLAALPGRRPDFSKFIFAVVAISLPLTIMETFLTRYGLTYPGVSDGVTGTFTAFFQGSLAVGALAGGALSDMRNTVAPFRVIPLLFLGAVVATAISPHPALVSVAFGLLGLAFGMRLTAFLPAVLRYADPHRVPTYTVVALTLIMVPRAVVPLATGGVLEAGLVTFRQIFLLSGILAGVGWAMCMRLEAPEKA